MTLVDRLGGRYVARLLTREELASLHTLETKAAVAKALRLALDGDEADEETIYHLFIGTGAGPLILQASYAQAARTRGSLDHFLEART